MTSRATAPVADKWAVMADNQAEANRLAAEESPAAAFRYLLGLFAEAHAEHRQYDGFWTEGVLVQFSRRVNGRGGVRWEKGDVAIARNVGDADHATAWAARVGWNVAITPAHTTTLFVR